MMNLQFNIKQLKQTPHKHYCTQKVNKSSNNKQTTIITGSPTHLMMVPTVPPLVVVMTRDVRERWSSDTSKARRLAAPPKAPILAPLTILPPVISGTIYEVNDFLHSGFLHMHKKCTSCRTEYNTFQHKYQRDHSDSLI